MSKFKFDKHAALGIAVGLCSLAAAAGKFFIDKTEKQQMEDKLVEKVVERLNSKQD